MIGSRPVVGSSKKMISGSPAMARASPTRLRMPPDSSAGDRAPTSAVSPTWASFSIATSFAASRRMPLPWIRPKATFSQTGRLSNRAAFWNSMPILALTFSRSPLDRWVTGWPSISISPCSGSIRPRMHFSMTDLPVPDPPMITTDSWGITSNVNPCRMRFCPKLLCTSVNRIFGVVSGGWVIVRRTSP